MEPPDSCDDITTASTFSSLNGWDFSSRNFVVLDVHVIVVCAAVYWMKTKGLGVQHLVRCAIGC